MQTRPLGSMAKSSSAPSNLRPARLTNFPARLLTSMRAAGEKRAPALSARVPSTKTSPARIMPCALAMESARPRSTTSASSRFGVDFAVMAREGWLLGSANYQVLGDFAQAACSFAVGSKLRDGLAGEIVCDFVGALQSVNCGVRSLLLCDIFSRGLAERDRRFFYVQNVVRDLKGPADGFAEAAETRDVVGACAGTERAGGDRSANKSGGLRAGVVFEHFLGGTPGPRLQNGGFATHQPVHRAPRGGGLLFPWR